MQAGTIQHARGNFGFIKPDSGGEDVFCLPPLGGVLPSVGTRVVFDIVVDPKSKTGTRADNLQLENASMAGGAQKASGTIQHVRGNFGFIKPDAGGDDVFCLPPLGGELPPVGTRVMYDVVVDPKSKTGIRAENLQLEMASMAGGSQKASGIVQHVKGNFGFIRPDAGGDDVFCLPPMGGQIPPVGTHVLYDVIVDSKTGKPRAENLQAGTRAFSARIPAGMYTGMVAHNKGKFGFIRQDSGTEDIFCFPPLGGELPPVGTRVVYSVMQDPKSKTGTRADNLQLEAAFMSGGFSSPAMSLGFSSPAMSFYGNVPHMGGTSASFAPSPCMRMASGTMLNHKGSFGFIKPDTGGEDVFCLPPLGGELPPVGTRVVYDIVSDPKSKTGTRAENLQPEMASMAGGGQKASGTIQNAKGNFGFIKPDSGGEDVFCLPPQGGELPPVGTRVVYDMVMDPKSKTGTRATNLQLETAFMTGGGRKASGTIQHVKGNFGFIKPDSGGEDVFCLPPKDGEIPAVGTRVVFDIVMDPKSKTGTRAENLQLEMDFLPGGAQTGTIQHAKGNFGFIKPDSGGEDVFCLPPKDGEIPPAGTPVQYEVIMDPKTGRPRAENLQIAYGMMGARPSMNVRSNPY